MIDMKDKMISNICTGVPKEEQNWNKFFIPKTLTGKKKKRKQKTSYLKLSQKKYYKD